MNAPEATCPSCGVEYSKHLGLIGTCKRVLELEEELHFIKREIQKNPDREDACNYIVGAIERLLRGGE